MDDHADKKNGAWLDDVRRWCSSRLPTAPKSMTPSPTVEAEPTDFSAMGYEAAQPSLQARHWPESSSSDFVDLK